MSESDAVGADEELRRQQAGSLYPTAVQALDALLGFLGDASWRVRRAAVASAARFVGHPDLAPRLVAALGDRENAGLRSASADVLTQVGRAAVPHLEQALARMDAQQRKFLVEILGSIGGHEALGTLASCLSDADENVRAVAVEALGRSSAGEARELVLGRLQMAESPQLAAYCLEALGRMGARMPFELLQRWLGQPELLRLVLRCLGQSGDAQAIPALIRALVSGPRGSRGIAARALLNLLQGLGQSESQSAHVLLAAEHTLEQALLGHLEDLDDDIARAAALLLARVGHPMVAVRLLAAAASRPFVAEVVQSVRRMGGNAVPHLLGAYATSDVETRVLILEVFESLGGGDGLHTHGLQPWLLEVAEGPELRTGEVAVRVLKSVGTAACVDGLMRLVGHSDPEMVRVATMALATVGGREPDVVLGKIVARLESQDVRPAWIAVIGMVGREEHAQWVVKATRHTDADVRCAAIDALAAYGRADDVEAFVLALADEHPQVRMGAVRALAQYPGARTVEALLVATHEADPWVVAEALRSLSALGGDAAIRTLESAAAAKQAPVAIAALQGLFRHNPPGLLKVVETALQHADPEVAREAILAGMRCPPSDVKRVLVGALRHRFWQVRLAAAEQCARMGIALSGEERDTLIHEESESLVRDALGRLA